MPKYPYIIVKLTGQNGNAFNILGICLREMHRAGLSKDECADFLKEATSGNYNNLLSTCIKWFNVE